MPRTKVYTDEEMVIRNRNSTYKYIAKNREKTRDWSKKYYEKNKAAVSERRKKAYSLRKEEKLAAVKTAGPVINTI
jgi:hypothetical protein